MFLCDLQPNPFAVMAESVGETDHARHHRVGDLHRDNEFAGAGADPDEGAVGEYPSARVVRMDLQAAAVRAFHQAGIIVHPGVVAPGLPAADQEQLLRVPWRGSE